MTEPDVTLTDYGLAAECVLFAYLLRRGDPRWIVFFVGGAVAALAGGTVHGFYLDPATLGARLLWPLSLLAVGLVAVAAWSIGARLVLSPAKARAVEMAAGAAWLAYAAAVVLGGAHAFGLVLLGYLPAALLLLVGFISRYRRTRDPVFLVGALGLGATFLAAAVQRAGHNAVYHGIQAAALVLLYVAAKHESC